ncbi:MAG: hypothetical protein ACLQU1_30380 [Bryobacteraceae bacterium]
MAAVEAIEPGVGADPQKSVARLKDRIDDVGAEAVFDREGGPDVAGCRLARVNRKNGLCGHRKEDQKSDAGSP